ncbi:Mitochondrial presequence protease [Elasticomyces elasticus]|uniref:Presequence protease, mitochondrial n=1 Tax=Elasticomyces elasticus TaxID=574655 RepID=A0AAN7W1L2_9PEZI|nr:Mitochondrial presequence protease [Elasticomyces elasticus]
MLHVRRRAVAPYAHALRSARCYATVQAGTKQHGFTLERSKPFPSLELSAYHYKHDRTGADYLHLARDDTNNVFSIAFKTNPPDSTGVPHILEHVTLCGSEKFPVRDPFFKMLPRSLQNFMNAMTSQDHTTYPFATTNSQDYRNLMSVYLDATLHPLLKQSDFVQEGWRVGPENPKNDSTGKDDLVFKGVVYNEMKGQVSDATYLFYINFFQHIIPALHNSGGDPQKMTDLTYEQLTGFHKAHYHPSNAKIITYGDQPVDKHMEMLSEQLNTFDKVPVDGDIKHPISLSGARTITVPGPVDPLTPPEAQFKTSTTWLAGSPADVHEAFALQLTNSLLLGGYGSPLYRTLIESGLGTDFSPNTGYDSSHGTALYSIGLTGVREENVPKVKETIVSTLREQVEKGFEKQKVDGLLHSLELGFKHKSSRFGLGIAQAVTGAWFNGVDPFEGLDYENILSTFRARFSQGRYLEGLVEKYLLNDNTLTFTMAPAASFGADLAAEEKQRLEQKIAEAVKEFPSEEEAYKQLRERELELIKEQDSGQTANVDCLPTLHVTDIPRQAKKVEVRDSKLDDKTKVQWRETATNGLSYFVGLSPFRDLPQELRMLVPLFCDALMRLGTKQKTMEELEDLIKLKTGGIRFGYYSTSSPHDVLKAEEGFQIGGTAFDGNVPAMYELLNTILVETDFDSPKAHGMIKELLRSSADGAVDAIASSGHRYASMSAGAELDPTGAWAEQTGGLTQVKYITGLASAESDEGAMSDLVHKLKALQAIVLHGMREGGFRAALTCGAEASGPNEEALRRYVESTRSATTSSPSPSSVSQQPAFNPTLGQNTFFPFPTYQVSYTGLSMPTGPYTSQTSAPYAILAQLLTHRHLHHEIREKGGAYGGGASSNGLAGRLGMYSYRDPNPANTLRIMRNAGRWATEREWTDREIEEAKLSVFQSVDAPLAVNKEGLGRFLQGIDYEMESQRRSWLLDVDASQVRRVAEEMAEKLEKGQANIAVLGAEEKFAPSERDGWHVKNMGSTVAPEVTA